VGALKQKRAAVTVQSREVVLQLYALESSLQQARVDLARIDARAAMLVRLQNSARQHYRAAQGTMTIAQQRLGRQLRILYEQDEPDPLAVVLGATSLADAIEGLEGLSRTARATRSVIEQARAARTLVRRTQRALAAQFARTLAVRTTIAATAAGLEQARGERASYLADLRREQKLTASQIATLEHRAQEARQRAQLVTEQATAGHPASPETTAASTSAAPAVTTTTTPKATAAATATITRADITTASAASTAGATTTATITTASAGPSEPPPVESVMQRTPSSPPTTPPPQPGEAMSVLVTGYCLKGTTATGLPVGPGVVAVDPTVIPLGTMMTIPGYGEGVAADTGGAIKGARIDVWFASCTAARDFTRTVTITFH
jgi:3D (Asp-Asp-Asp) domain-containing protein/peptidoglycan hydrolase CwlO-like protein